MGFNAGGLALFVLTDMVRACPLVVVVVVVVVVAVEVVEVARDMLAIAGHVPAQLLLYSTLGGRHVGDACVGVAV